jgi:hypothetical protein
VVAKEPDPPHRTPGLVSEPQAESQELEPGGTLGKIG